jgi:hypothetical protein
VPIFAALSLAWPFKDRIGADIPPASFLKMRQEKDLALQEKSTYEITHVMHSNVGK